LLERRPAASLVAWDVKADPDAYPVELRARLVHQAQVITLNRGEIAFVAQAVSGGRSFADDEARLQRVRAVTPGVLAITSGEAGVRILWPDGDVHVPASPVPNVDPTGAGDAFFAGFLGAMLRRQDPVAAGRAAVIEAASFLKGKKEKRLE
jgi:sugar/nucleoside kinase (ribokinase family)